MSELLIDNIPAKDIVQQMIARGLIRPADDPIELVKKAMKQGLIRHRAANDIEAELEKETDPLVRQKLYRFRFISKKENAK